MSDSPDGALAGAAEPAAEAALPKDRPRGIGRRIASGALSYGVVALVLYYLVNELSDSQNVSAAFGSITPWQWALFAVLGVVNLATNWPPIAIALPGLRIREAAVTNTASAALSNTVPEGGAVATGLNFAMLRSWGFRLADITSEVVVTGTWSQMTKYLLLALSLVAVFLQGWGPEWVGWAALAVCVLYAVAVVVLGLILRSEPLARGLGRLGDRVWGGLTGLLRHRRDAHLAESVPRFRALMVALLADRWGRLTAAMLVSQLTAAAVLGLACRVQGLDRSAVSWAVILVAWGGATLASLIVPVPGGLGVAEVVLTAILSFGLPASDQPAVLAAVILYRFATFLVPIPIGLVSYLYWRMSTAWRRPVDSRPVRLGRQARG